VELTPAYSAAFDGELLSLNRERKKGGRFLRQTNTEYWRGAFEIVGRRCPSFERVGFVVSIAQCKGSVLADPVNYYPSVKAAIDGLVRAGLIPDDNPEHVAWIRFDAPTRNEGQSTSVLTIEVFDLSDS
jgi:hypothetical protein